MKNLLTLFLLGLNYYAFSQNYTLQLVTGSFTPKENITDKVKSHEVVNNHYYRIIQFYQIPSNEQKAVIELLGVKLFNYLPNNCFWASIPIGLSITKINTDRNVRSIFTLEDKYKLSSDLLQQKYPDYAKKAGNKIELILLHHPDLRTEQVANLLNEQGVAIAHTLTDQQGFRVIVDTSEIAPLASLPYLYFVEPVDSDPPPENLVERTNHRSNFIATDYYGGLKYDGTGVSVALNDDGVIGPHIDYAGRILNQYITFNNGDHGDHCAGIIFGGGNIDPATRGMAFGAQLGVYGVSGSFANTFQAFDSITKHYSTLNTRIISTSYGDGNNTGYTSRARLMDLQINSMPELMHVFSAGNSGTSDYGYGAGTGWGNITGGHKQAKNVITVGNLSYIDALASSSSRGPAKDGRIKPDICAVGTNVISTINPNTYQSKSGTSMACPGVAGTLAQLYQAYKDVNSNNNPPSALIKAACLNTADDLGNAGPDYRFGYGRINVRRAWDVLKNNQYSIDSISQGNFKNHSIIVPANVAELRVMVYWHDKEATAGVSKALVNNLNIWVTTPNSASVLPWVLDKTPNAITLNNSAVQGVDTLNNMEQVTITNPVAGMYLVNVDGFAVPNGPQKYVIVYEFVKDEITVTYPIGGESFAPGVQETIRWDAIGTTGNFTIKYSVDSGINWTNITTTASGSVRNYQWTVPASVVTGKALIQVSRGTLSDQSDAKFSIIGVPTNLTLNWVCIDSFQVSYNSVSGATGYIVTALGNQYMDSVATSTTTSCVVREVNTAMTGWYSVQAIGPNGCIGRRALAKTRQILPYNCVIKDDLGIVGLSAPNDSSIINCQFNTLTDTPSIQIFNNGLTTLTNTIVGYSVNGGTPVTENYNGTIAGQALVTHTFSLPIVFSAPGIYSIKFWIQNILDSNLVNDTISLTKHIIQPIVVTLPIYQTFETFATCDTSANCGTEQCLLSDGWINERNDFDDEIDWRINSGPTPSASVNGNTGPQMDFNPGTATGKYAYLESDNCSNKTAGIISPCINLTNALSPQLSFAYHMFGAGTGSLHVDILLNGVWVNDIAAAVSGNQGNSWKTASITLNNYVGQTINIRFRGISGVNGESDIAIDDIKIAEPTGIAATELSATQIYPNPSKSIFYIQLPGKGMTHMHVVDINGRIVLDSYTDKQLAILDLQNKPSGVYVVTIMNSTSIVVRKVVKL